MTMYYGYLSLSTEKVKNPCVDCKFYQEKRVGFLWKDKELYCNNAAEKIRGYDVITGKAVKFNPQQLNYARNYECNNGKNFVKRCDL